MTVAPPQSRSEGPIDFLVSYTRGDRAWAEWVAWQLEGAGYVHIVEPWHAEASPDYEDKIHHAMKQFAPRALLFVLGEGYGADEWIVPLHRWLEALEYPSLLVVEAGSKGPDKIIGSAATANVTGLAETEARDVLVRAAASLVPLRDRAKGKQQAVDSAPFPGRAEQPPAPPAPAARRDVPAPQVSQTVVRVFRYAGAIAPDPESIEPEHLLAALLHWIPRVESATTTNEAIAAFDGFLRARGESASAVALALARGTGVEALPAEDLSARTLGRLAADHPLLRRAGAIAAETAPGHRLGTRHVLAAFVEPEPDEALASAQRRLEELNAPVETLRAVVRDAVKRIRRTDDQAAWDRVLHLGARVDVLPGYVSDTAVGADRLGITADVNAIASIIAAKTVEPPLSIGLFGDWGTGKSFFMRKLDERIALLAEQSRQAEARGEESYYHSNVRQIWFNAWHYVEANLWASLVAHIFESLTLSENGDAGEEAQIAQMVEQLETAKALLTTAEESRRGLERLHDQAQEDLKTVANERGSLLDELKSVRAGDLADVLENPDVQEPLAQVGERLGVKPETTSDIRALAQDLAFIGGRARYVWRLVSQSATRLLLAGGATLVIVVVAAVAALHGVDPLAAVTTLLAWLGAVAGALRRPVHDVRLAAGAAAAAAQSANAIESRERAEREEELRRQIRELEADEQRLTAEAAEAQRRINEVEQEIDDIRRGRRLYAFLDERAGTQDYRRHLGLVALVHRDFNQLSTLLRQARNKRAAGQADNSLPRIDRIVLYIDDLDRCPARRVVQVLEAVHLLLAFDLFVVVVGVDSRWLLRSLERHYRQMRSREDGNDRDSDFWESTPHNYVEKIFQIPFTLRPMEPAGFKRLVGSLVDVRPEAAVRTATAPAAGAARPDAIESASEAERPAPEAETAATAPAEAAAPAPAETRDAEVDLTPGHLRLHRHELACIEELAPLVSTPRAAKRLVNIYRLLRASVQPHEFPQLVESEHREALLLTAFVVGFPDEAPEVFAAIGSAASPEHFAKLFGKLRREGELPDLLRFPEANFRLAVLQRWAPRVARYSFQTGRLVTAGPRPRDEEAEEGSRPLRRPQRRSW